MNIRDLFDKHFYAIYFLPAILVGGQFIANLEFTHYVLRQLQTGFSMEVISGYIPEFLSSLPLFTYWIILSLFVFVAYLLFSDTYESIKDFFAEELSDEDYDIKKLSAYKTALVVGFVSLYLLVFVGAFFLMVPGVNYILHYNWPVLMGINITSVTIALIISYLGWFIYIALSLGLDEWLKSRLMSVSIFENHYVKYE